MYATESVKTLKTYQPPEIMTGKKASKTTPATCTAEGSKEYTCSVCGQTKSEAIEKIAHNIVTVVDSQPTCGAAGKQHQECSVCHGERTDLEDLPATGNHDWKESKTTLATCTAEGSKEYTCSVCGQTKSAACATVRLQHLAICRQLENIPGAIM